MRGIILAAGRGSRLGGLTAERPKCLVPLAGRPLLDWQRAALTAAGISDLAVVVGYRRELVDAADLTVLHAARWAETNMVGSLLAAEKWLSAGPCVVSYADIVYSAATVRRLAAAPGELAIAYDPAWAELWRRRFADPRDDAETFRLAADGALADIGARPATMEEVQGQYMGLLRFTPPAWSAVRALLDTLSPAEVDALDMTSLLRMLLSAGRRIETVACDGAWGEVDSGTDLAVCEDLVARGDLRLDEQRKELS
ncbi:phosphocholine cytidylyltransferase family protein [Actinoplanes hulinensis]|uniref:Phosphocholine cytidylyltransferase family protein n=1 Tax=Actinoplanes hulinensis TaxID=1144547 RepID=A0ABS7B9K1_9ACTN|nr:phosphocholine cytidylyltransferase family protein [Actinoplanes hulinensis]MBW6437316.1 phosphocholine cytidylyltransferase family protein [Actinoplanes hulinensis]